MVRTINGYRYGYNGMEMDNEVNGNGNSYTTEFRQYDPRLGRWKSLDPLMAKYPGMSPYVAFNNNPIFFIDPYGLEGVNPDEANEGGGAGDKGGFRMKDFDQVDEPQQRNPTPAGQTPKDWELKYYSFDIESNVWKVSNDWRLKADEEFRQKMKAISKRAKEIAKEGSKIGLTSSLSNKDLQFGDIIGNEGSYPGFDLKLHYLTKERIKVPVTIQIAELVYYSSSERALEINDFEGVLEEGTNCFANVLGLFGNIDYFSQFITIARDKGYELISSKEQEQVGDIWLSDNGGHAMVVIKIIAGQSIYRSTNRNYGTMEGTFDEVNYSQFNGSLQKKARKIMRKK